MSDRELKCFYVLKRSIVNGSLKDIDELENKAAEPRYWVVGERFRLNNLN